jgi:hypothetical protein
MSVSANTKKRSSQGPFEEPILVKYSPHHEFPLSSVSSVAIHALVIGVLIIGGIILARLNWNTGDQPLPVDALSLEPAGGGGGNPNAVGPGPGDGDLPPPVENAPLPDPNEKVVDPQKREHLEQAKKDVLSLPEFKDEESKRLIEDANKATTSWLNLNKDVREKLQKGLLAGQGKGGSGSGGGEGTGTGTGKGGGVGPGTGSGERSKRLLRWVLIFNTRDGRDYVRQLDAFGAIVAFPDPRDPNNYLVVRDLRETPAQPKAEDISKIERIYWIDDGAASVRSLAGALGLAQTPPHFVVFFAREFEEKLLNLELRYRGKQENEISETRFDVRRSGNSYEPVVVSQR